MAYKGWGVGVISVAVMALFGWPYNDLHLFMGELYCVPMPRVSKLVILTIVHQCPQKLNKHASKFPQPYYIMNRKTYTIATMHTM